MSESLGGSIFAVTVTIPGLASVVKLASMAKEILVARFLGASDGLDCFYVAFLLPTFFVGIIMSSCNEAFIPTYIEVRENEGASAAQRIFASATFVNVGVLLILASALAVAQRWALPVLGSGFSRAKLDFTSVLFFFLLASFLISGLSALWRAVLNAHECFALTATAPIAIPLLTVIFLIASPQRWGVYGLTFGSIVGVAGELVILGSGLRRHGIALAPCWNGLDLRLRQILRQAAPSAAAGILMGCTTLVDQSMAAMLPSRSVSILNYANKLVPVLLGVGTASLSVVVLPVLSRLSAGRQWIRLRRTISTWTWIVFLVGVPATALLIAFSEPIIKLLFQHGAFTSQSTHLVAGVQSLLCLEIPFYAATILCVNALCALKRNGVLMWGTAIAVAENAMLNLVFMRVFGLAGIALSTSAVYLTAFIYLRVMLGRVLKSLENKGDRLSEPAVAASLSLSV